MHLQIQQRLTPPPTTKTQVKTFLETLWLCPGDFKEVLAKTWNSPTVLHKLFSGSLNRHCIAAGLFPISCILLLPLHTALSDTELTPAAFCGMLDYKIPHWVPCWASQARGAAHVIARPSPDVVCELFCCQGWACAEELGAILGKNLSWFWRAVDLKVRKVLMVELSEI